MPFNKDNCRKGVCTISVRLRQEGVTAEDDRERLG